MDARESPERLEMLGVIASGLRQLADARERKEDLHRQQREEMADTLKSAFYFVVSLMLPMLYLLDRFDSWPLWRLLAVGLPLILVWHLIVALLLNVGVAVVRRWVLRRPFGD